MLSRDVDVNSQLKNNKNKMGRTIVKFQGAVTKQGASIAALTVTAKVLQTTVAYLVAIHQTKKMVHVQVYKEQSGIVQKNHDNIKTIVAQQPLWPGITVPQFPQQLRSTAIPSWPVPFQFPPNSQMTTSTSL